MSSRQPEHKLYAESETKLFWRVVNAELEFKVDADGKITEITHRQSGQELLVTKVE